MSMFGLQKGATKPPYNPNQPPAGGGGPALPADDLHAVMGAAYWADNKRGNKSNTITRFELNNVKDELKSYADNATGSSAAYLKARYEKCIDMIQNFDQIDTDNKGHLSISELNNYYNIQFTRDQM